MSQRRQTILIVVGVLVVLFVVFQIIPWGNLVPAFARTNPPVERQIQWDSAQTEQLMRTACFDCHSNETVWPWYSQIAPVSWLVAKDVNEGRREFNLSATRTELEADEMISQIRRGAMPPAFYKLLHPAASLSEQQQADLIAGLQATFGG